MKLALERKACLSSTYVAWSRAVFHTEKNSSAPGMALSNDTELELLSVRDGKLSIVVFEGGC